MKLENKVFIITGSTSGMGKEIALEFTRQGALLVLSGRDRGRGEVVLREIEELNGSASFHTGDVGKQEVNRELVEMAMKRYGRVNGVVTNAGELGLGKVTEIETAAWYRTFRTNLDSVFFLLKYAIPQMKKTNAGVAVVNASIAASKSFPEHPAYCASKAALVALARQVALDYGPEIRINTICPGPVDTPFLHQSGIEVEAKYGTA